MTKETITPAEAETDPKALRPTVFSDGSTFDYIHGYRSNGAPTPTRDRTDVPRIAKTGSMLSANGLANLIISLILLAVIGFVAFLGIKAFHNQANETSIINNINVSGQAQVVGTKMLHEGDRSILVVRDAQDHSVYRCDVHILVEESAKAMVFCNPGPVNFTLPVPYDPENIFYTTPAQN